MNTSTDAWSILGIDAGADEATIKRAYAGLTQDALDEPDNEATLAALDEAYATALASVGAAPEVGNPPPQPEAVPEADAEAAADADMLLAPLDFAATLDEEPTPRPAPPMAPMEAFELAPLSFDEAPELPALAAAIQESQPAPVPSAPATSDTAFPTLDFTPTLDAATPATVPTIAPTELPTLDFAPTLDETDAPTGTAPAIAPAEPQTLDFAPTLDETELAADAGAAVADAPALEFAAQPDKAAALEFATLPDDAGALEFAALTDDAPSLEFAAQPDDAASLEFAPLQDDTPAREISAPPDDARALDFALPQTDPVALEFAAQPDELATPGLVAEEAPRSDEAPAAADAPAFDFTPLPDDAATSRGEPAATLDDVAAASSDATDAAPSGIADEVTPIAAEASSHFVDDVEPGANADAILAAALAATAAEVAAIPQREAIPGVPTATAAPSAQTPLLLQGAWTLAFTLLAAIVLLTSKAQAPDPLLNFAMPACLLAYLAAHLSTLTRSKTAVAVGAGLTLGAIGSFGGALAAPFAASASIFTWLSLRVLSTSAHPGSTRQQQIQRAAWFGAGVVITYFIPWQEARLVLFWLWLSAAALLLRPAGQRLPWVAAALALLAIAAVALLKLAALPSLFADARIDLLSPLIAYSTCTMLLNAIDDWHQQQFNHS